MQTNLHYLVSFNSFVYFCSYHCFFVFAKPLILIICSWFLLQDIEFHPELSGTNTNTHITVIIVNSSHGSSFCQQSIMKETAQGESNRTDGGMVFQAANCGCALIDTSPELRQVKLNLEYTVNDMFKTHLFL